MKKSLQHKVDYGIDAPGALLNFLFGGLLNLALSVAINRIPAKGKMLPVRKLASRMFFGSGISLISNCGVMLWGSKFAKLKLRDRLLDQFSWRGDEQVLDVGCGHGLMLIGAAKRLHTGKAVGVDTWQQNAQIGNRPEATWQNIQLEGVADRTEILQADARQLPFADASFDLVLSSWALHHLPDPEGRARAIQEIIRVLRPGGSVLIADTERTDEYLAIFQAGGLSVEKLGTSPLFVTPTVILKAEKPAIWISLN